MDSTAALSDESAGFWELVLLRVPWWLLEQRRLELPLVGPNYGMPGYRDGSLGLRLVLSELQPALSGALGSPKLLSGGINTGTAGRKIFKKCRFRY